MLSSCASEQIKRFRTEWLINPNFFIPLQFQLLRNYFEMKKITTLHKVQCMLKKMSVVWLCGMLGLMLVSCYESDEVNIDPIHAIDLGLSVEWAWCNMGANRPEKTGSRCAWGEIGPKSDYWIDNKSDYLHYNATTGAFRYLGTNISGTSYDVAHTVLGDGWRLPTQEEMQELVDECTWEWVYLYGDDYYANYTADDEDNGNVDYSTFSGFLITGPNGNQIFLPGVHYWSGTNASFGTADPTSYMLSASSGGNAAIKSEPCYYAKYIRPVKGELKSAEDEEETSSSLGKTYTVNGVSFKMIGIEKGSFTMGATSEQNYSDTKNDERPTHQVILSDYAIGETEVTQALWQAVMGSNPSGFTGNLQRPVEGVSWYDCQNFIYKLNQLTGENFRLPTEAEWEYAARGGFNSLRYVYSGNDEVHFVAWYFTNSDYETHPVKKQISNELGIYDMSGNVSEWCYDWYGSYSSATQTNPTGALEIGSTKTKVIRGGGYNSRDYSCRVSSRSHLEPTTKLTGHIGLRLAKSKSNVGVPTQQVCFVTTGEALGITDSGATIQGTVNGTDKPVTCGVIYGTTDNLDATNGTMVTTTAKGDYSVELTGLEAGTTYYYRVFIVTNEGEYKYGEVCSFVTKKNLINGHEVVDLGLSVKWASCNVGAESPEEYGDYFAWGETATKSDYSSSTSVTYGLSVEELEFRGIIGPEGNLTAAYDAGTVNWGESWRMPTLDEMKELFNNCTWEWTTQNGVKGYKFTGLNGNLIFLPAAGYRDNTSLYGAGSHGYYWSATPYSDGDYAFYLFFYSDNYYWDYSYRYYGRTVRPVSK